MIKKHSYSANILLYAFVTALIYTKRHVKLKLFNVK